MQWLARASPMGPDGSVCFLGQRDVGRTGPSSVARAFGTPFALTFILSAWRRYCGLLLPLQEGLKALHRSGWGGRQGLRRRRLSLRPLPAAAALGRSDVHAPAGSAFTPFLRAIICVAGGVPLPTWLPPSARGLRVFSGSVGARMLAQFGPVRFGHVDAVMLGCLLDVGERQLAVLIRNADCLIESGNGVSDVARVGHRLLALFGEREDAVRQVATFGQLSVLFVGFPGRFHRFDLLNNEFGLPVDNRTALAAGGSDPATLLH